MDKELLGYLLDSLDPAERAEVDRYLATSPEARRKLAQLERSLDPLRLDREPIPPPDGLAARTMRFIADRVPGHAVPRKTVPFRGGRHQSGGSWRRADVVVAASIGLWFLVMIPPSLTYIRYRQGQVECADNLRLIHAAFTSYADGHNGQYPVLNPVEGPLARAGAYGVHLSEAGHWNERMRFNCPGNSTEYTRPPSRKDLEGCSDPAAWKRLGGCYAYNVGYHDDSNVYRGAHRGLGNNVPLLSDRPNRSDEAADWKVRNSPNHNGVGQNVLFSGGHVRYMKNRVVAGDDLFLNRDGRLAPGRGPGDAVLAPGDVSPFGLTD